MPDLSGVLGVISSFFSGHSSITLLLTALVSTGLFSHSGFLKEVGLWSTLKPYRPWMLVVFIIFSALTVIKTIVYLTPRVVKFIKHRFWDPFWTKREMIKSLRQLSPDEKDILGEFAGEEGEEVNFFYSRNNTVRKLWREKGVLRKIDARPRAGGGPEMGGFRLSDWAKERIKKNPELLLDEDSAGN